MVLLLKTRKVKHR